MFSSGNNIRLEPEWWEHMLILLRLVTSVPRPKCKCQRGPPYALLREIGSGSTQERDLASGPSKHIHALQGLGSLNHLPCASDKLPGLLGWREDSTQERGEDSHWFSPAVEMTMYFKIAIHMDTLSICRVGIFPYNLHIKVTCVYNSDIEIISFYYSSVTLRCSQHWNSDDLWTLRKPPFLYFSLDISLISLLNNRNVFHAFAAWMKLS